MTVAAIGFFASSSGVRYRFAAQSGRSEVTLIEQVHPSFKNDVAGVFLAQHESSYGDIQCLLLLPLLGAWLTIFSPASFSSAGFRSIVKSSRVDR
jgi:hypothetical protein